MNEEATPLQDENSLVAERRGKLAALRGRGIAFPNDFRRADHAGDLQATYADADKWSGEALEAEGIRVSIAAQRSWSTCSRAASPMRIISIRISRLPCPNRNSRPSAPA